MKLRFWWALTCLFSVIFSGCDNSITGSSGDDIGGEFGNNKISLSSSHSAINLTEGISVDIVILFSEPAPSSGTLSWSISSPESNFSVTSGTLTISQGDTSVTSRITPTDDNKVESNESSLLIYQGDLFLNSLQLTLNVLDNDTAPLAPISVTATEISKSHFNAAFVKATDNDHTIIDFEYAIGTSSGDDSIVAWTSIGNINSLTIEATSLTLTSGQTYFMSVRSKDSVGNFSSPTSDSIQVDSDLISLTFDSSFDSYSANFDPPDILDTNSGNSLLFSDLFNTADVSSNICLGTSSTATNIHSHYVGSGSHLMSNYKVRGRMRRSSTNGHLGVTGFSDFTNSDSYYRFRSGSGNEIQLVPHSTSFSGGKLSMVYPLNDDTWYRYEVQFRDTGALTDVRAKIWEEGESEPADWMLSGYDDSGSRLTSGTFGMWSMGPGDKFWDDFELRNLMPGDTTRVYDTAALPYNENFESIEVNAQPDNWLDTADSNSMNESPGIFTSFNLSGNKTFGSDFDGDNFHSHYMAAGSASWTHYEYSGRMRIDAANTSVGVTFFSDYPNSNTYYRLRKYYTNNYFEILPHGTTTTSGVCTSSLIVSQNTWYRFKAQVSNEGSQTRILAKVWADGSTEPGSFEINCIDANAGHLTQGTVGVWSHGAGTKYWDDLQVISLP